jgi:hypothetical protein
MSAPEASATAATLPAIAVAPALPDADVWARPQDLPGAR